MTPGNVLIKSPSKTIKPQDGQKATTGHSHTKGKVKYLLSTGTAFSLNNMYM
jgi:hypothetical protein